MLNFENRYFCTSSRLAAGVSKAARVSLASLYLREGKPQKALLELRKAVGDKEPSTIHTVSALSIMEAIHEEGEEPALARKAKQDKVGHLANLADDARKAGDDAGLGYYLLCLGQEQALLGEFIMAKTFLNEVVSMGPGRAGQGAVTQAQTLLKTIG